MAVAYVHEAPGAAAAEATSLPLWPLSVSKYHEMIDAGILTKDDRVELLAGLLVPKMSQNPPHAVATAWMTDRFGEIRLPGWHLRVQLPVTFDDSEPEPDIALVRGRPTRYQQRHPEAQDIALIVEVADSSLDRDCRIKRAIYARAGIPVYWIVNLRDRQVEAYSEPDGPRYGHQDIYTGLMPVSVEGAVGELDLETLWNPEPE